MATDREFLTATPDARACLLPAPWHPILASPLDDIRGIADEDLPDADEEDEDDEEEEDDFDEEEDLEEDDEESEPEAGA